MTIPGQKPQIQRESKEFLIVEPLVDGLPPTSTFSIALLPRGERPDEETDWSTSETLEGRTGKLIGPFTQPGELTVWVRVNDENPEVPVLVAGAVRIL